MRIIHTIRAKPERFLIALLAVLVFVTLLVIDWQRLFLSLPGHATYSSDVLRFGASALIALFFLALGIFVWLFARERLVALLLFCFSFTMMMAFALQTGALSNDRILTAISDSGAALSLALLATLLLFFPVSHYTNLREQKLQIRGIFGPHQRLKLLQGYLLLMWTLISSAVILYILYYLFEISAVSSWSDALANVYSLIALSSIIVTIIYTYRHTTKQRERQQLRFFMIGVIGAVAPFLLLTILPEVLANFGLPVGQFAVDSQITTAPAILLPAAFGYSILRYQIMSFDRYIQRVVSWTMGVILLAVLGYCVAVICGLLFAQNAIAYSGVLIGSLLVLAPICWRLAHFITERSFFNEMRHYRRLLERPDALVRETIDINKAAELLTLAVVNTFETSEACLLVYDRESGYFQLAPPLQGDNARDDFRQHLTSRLMAAVEPGGDEEDHDETLSHPNAGWIEADRLVVRNVNHARRPLFLSEAVRPEGEQPTGLARFISTEDVTKEPLLVAVRVQGVMIGLLALGERGDQGQYAGPDFEAIDLLLTHYSPILENARLYEQASRHGAMLDAIYSSHITLERPHERIDEVASAYASVAAETAKASAHVWLVSGKTQTPRLVSQTGDGPKLSIEKELQERDWQAWFYEGPSPEMGNVLPSDIPSCFEQMPSFPCVWLPLEKGEQRYGLLALTYTHSHRFAEEEKHLWSMFANQCAAALENAQANIDLREAYERQKELDRLKDQFIMTASHELRTPLTTVQGYIDLLQTFGDRITPQERADFISKAGTGCDELTLMINNMMDAISVQEEVEGIELAPVALAEPIASVLEMLNGSITLQQRQVTVKIAPDVVVKAEEQRLKQIILNLLGNALKYSPPGSPIEISAHAGDAAGQQALCTLRIRDYGSGVPFEEQQRLFERFVRLERDMNSPVRGTGLGLYICKQLSEAMGGSIWVESTGTAGEGSAFVVALKLHHPAQMPVS